MRINGSSQSFPWLHENLKMKSYRVYRKHPGLHFLHIVAVFHSEGPLSRIWICQTRSNKVMYDFHTAHNTSLGNFIYHAWAVLTAPISSVWELRAAQKKERQISTMKQVLYHSDQADYNLFCIYVYMCTCKDDKSHLNVLLGCEWFMS